MRSLIITASALALAVPAAVSAQPAPPRPVDEEIVRNLPDQRELEAAGEAVGRVAEALLDVPVGPIVQAVDPGRRLSRRERERTLGDVASRDDPYVRERVRDSVENVAVGVGGMVEQLAVLTPVLRRTLEDAAHRVDDAMRDAAARRSHDRRDRDHDRTDRDDERDRDGEEDRSDRRND